ncbi:pyruvate dehydrogenase complex E1 component subunit beta [Fontivita pretiosa]|uniref:pyruvate dehydrogenase complex E1 component subunit beta n=1 Tax=Fontivita pretiosa TaxID=2989684 RepID=UPI003D172369
MPEIQFREALRQAMWEEMERDENVFLMGEEVGQYNGAYKVSEGMLAHFGPRRVLDTPISEAGFAGLGIGAAMAGLRPIIEFMSWSFSLVCFDQLVNNAANIRYMSGGQVKLPIVFRGGNGIAHQLGATHSHRVEAWYARVPGLVVIAPSNPYDAKGLLKSAIRCDDPVIFLESELMLNDRGEVPEGEYTVPIGVADVKRRGDDVTLVSYGKVMKMVLRAADELARHHQIEADVIDLRTLRPLDEQAIIDSVQKTHRLVVVDEDWPFCGMGAGIQARLGEKLFDDLDAPIKRVCSEDVPVPFNHYLELAMQPSVEKVVQAVKEVCYR